MFKLKVVNFNCGRDFDNSSRDSILVKLLN